MSRKTLFLLSLLLGLSVTAATAQDDFDNRGAVCVSVDRAYIDRLEAEEQAVSVPEDARIITPDAILILLDGSGSMNEPIPGGIDTRITAAKAVLNEYVNALPDDATVGLQLFNGNCQTHTLAPIGPLDRRRLFNVINGVSPNGSTPIAASIEAAGALLADVEGVREVVLVSDGEETCGGDPVEVARRLAASDPDLNLAIHVVGFGVLSDVSAQDNLRLIPRVANGVFIPAEDAAELSQALAVTSRIPYFVSDTSGNLLDDGLANRSSLPFDAGTYLVDIPALNVSQQVVEVLNGRGTSVEIDAEGEVSIVSNDPLCIAEFCPSVPLPRLAAGEKGRVSAADPRPVNVRNAPGTSASRIGQMEVGTEFEILSGPICADGYLWWQIRTDSISGWSAEGVPGNYFLEPLP